MSSAAIILLGTVLIIAAVIFSSIAFVYLAPALATKFALGAVRKLSGLVRKEINLPNGLRMFYLEGGQGEPLMLLHGFGGNKDSFARVSRFLVQRYRVIIPDITGFGESTRPPHADYSSCAQVERLRALAQALKLSGLHLGGNSMGGQIALLYAARHPTEVASLWLLSAAVARSSFKPEVLKLIASGHNPLIARNVQEFSAVMALGMSRPPYVPKPMLKVLAQERIVNAALEVQILQQLLDYSVENEIAGLETPTLIVFGEQDRVIAGTTADVLSKLLPRSKLVLVRNAGHVPMFEKPQQCANDYVSFRESTLKAAGH